MTQPFPFSESDIERAACPGCHSARARPTPYRRAPFEVAACLECGLYYLSTRLPEARMQALYRSSDYFTDGSVAGYPSYAEQESSLRRTFRRLLAAMQARGLTGGTLLEVGCGYGFFLDEARGKFATRTGTELSPHALATARLRADRILEGGVAQLDPGERFSCIVALQVLEHIYDPAPWLRALFDHLVPGGHLVLAVPDMGSLWRRALGNHWPSFKWPEHVAFYDRRTLIELVRRAGLGEAAPLPHPHAFPLGEIANKLGIRMTGSIASKSVWLPGTVISAFVTKPDR